MPKKKRNITSVGEQIEKDLDKKSKKLSLNSILKPDHAKTITDILFDRCVAMTITIAAIQSRAWNKDFPWLPKKKILDYRLFWALIQK